MYRALVFTFFIVAAVLVINKEHGLSQKSNLEYLFDKITYEISILKKIPKDSIYYSSKFDQNLGMNMIDVETLGITMRKELKVHYKVTDFSKTKDVGEAIDFLRIKLESKKKAESGGSENP